MGEQVPVRPGLGVSFTRRWCPSGARTWGCPQWLVAPPRQMWEEGSCTPVGCGTGRQELAVPCTAVPSPHASGPDLYPTPSITFPVDLTPFQMQK